jgi:hypothetical protein
MDMCVNAKVSCPGYSYYYCDECSEDYTRSMSWMSCERSMKMCRDNCCAFQSVWSFVGRRDKGCLHHDLVCGLFVELFFELSEWGSRYLHFVLSQVSAVADRFRMLADSSTALRQLSRQLFSQNL